MDITPENQDTRPFNPTLMFDADEIEKIAEVAQRRGYSSSKLFLRALVDFDVVENDEALVFDDDDDDQMILERLERSLHDALTGRVLPLSTLWQDEDE